MVGGKSVSYSTYNEPIDFLLLLQFDEAIGI